MVEIEKVVIEPQTYKSSPYATKLVRMAAGEVSRQWGVNYINPEFLLAALIAEGSTNTLFEEQGIAVDRVTQEIIEVIKPQFKSTASIEPIADPWGRLTNRSRRVLWNAEQNATAEKRDISGPDMLRAMIEEGESQAFRILKAIGFQSGASSPQE